MRKNFISYWDLTCFRIRKCIFTWNFSTCFQCHFLHSKIHAITKNYLVFIIYLFFSLFSFLTSVRWNKVPSVENLGNFELLIDEELATQQTQDDNLLSGNLASGKPSRVNNRWKWNERKKEKNWYFFYMSEQKELNEIIDNFFLYPYD